MAAEPIYQALFLGAGEQMHCGVGQFTRLSYEAVEEFDPGSSTTLTLTRSEGSLAEIWRAVGSAQNVVCNFPLVAWKRVMFRPLAALLIARLRGRRVILLQHEWAGLHWLRRITYLPALLLADFIVMFSPLVRRELAADRLVGWTARKCVLAPLPPNIEAPAGIANSRLRQRLAAAREEGRLIVGHFGSIYPGKQPTALLQIGAILAERGLKPLIVYIGSFIYGVDDVEQESMPAPPNSASSTMSSSAAMSRPTTRCSACSARSTPSAMYSTKVSPRGAPASWPAHNPCAPSS